MAKPERKNLDHLSKIIASSEHRMDIEKRLFFTDTPLHDLAMELSKEFNEIITVEMLYAYKQKYSFKGKSLTETVLKATQDLVKTELPPSDDMDELAIHFSFKRINEDLQIIYDRIDTLNKLAIDSPSDDSYDRRIDNYIKRAESIRSGLIKNQFNNLRKAILLNIGKKIAVAAIGIFMPYVSPGNRDEAKRRFMAAIEPLLNLDVVGKEPENISDIKKERDGEQA